MLDLGAEQSHDGRTERAVHVELDEFVTIHAYRPRRVDLRHDAVLEFEDAVRGVFRGRDVVLAVLVPPVADVHRCLRIHGGDPAEQVLHYVVPVREHVDDDAAAIFRAVIPAGTLGRLPIAFEDPVSEFAAHREDAPEEAGIDQPPQLLQPRQIELVVHDSCLDAGFRREAREIQRFVHRLRGGLLRVDRLTGRDRLAEGPDARLRHEEVGVDLPPRVGERRVEVRRVVLDAVTGGEVGEFRRASADQDGLHGHLAAIGKNDAALVADGEDRPDEVLTVAHPARDTVHDDADFTHACCGGIGGRGTSCQQ